MAALGKGFLRMIASIAPTTDEQELRAADRMAEGRDVVCGEIRARMKKNSIYCRQMFADAQHVMDKLTGDWDKLDEAMQDSEATEGELLAFKRDAEADVALQARQPVWSQALSNLMQAAEGDDDSTWSDNASSAELAKLMCEHLVQGEPSCTSVAVVLYHPNSPITDAVRVEYVMGDVPFKKGAGLRRKGKSNDALTTAIWEVITTGSPKLTNLHGLSEGTISIVPLFSSTRCIFGAVVSGPGAVPDQFLETMTRTAGQMFERIGKFEIVERMIKNVEAFILKQCSADHNLVYVKWARDATIPQQRDEWAWQPLLYTSPSNEKRFELPLTWADGKPIGVFSVTAGTFTSMDENLIILLHTLAPMMKEAVAAVQKMELGTKPPLGTMSEVMNKFDEEFHKIPDILGAEICRAVKTSQTFYLAIVELLQYGARIEDDEMLKLFQALLALAGFPKVKTWDGVHKQMKNARALVDSIAIVDVVTTPKKENEKKSKEKTAAAERWNRAEVALKDLDLTQLSARSPVPVRLLIRWLNMARMIHHISIAVQSGTISKDPIAEQLFKQMDKDDSGILSTDEVIAFLLKVAGREHALKLVRVLDVNGDGFITNEEWHKGWQLGEFQVKDGNSAGAVSPSMLISKHLAEEKAKKKKAAQKSSKVAPAPAPA